MAPTKSEQTRQRILDAAAYVLSRQGYAGTRLSDIAERANIRISTLYYYFESREALVADVLLSGSTDVHAHVEAAVEKLAAQATPIDKVCAAAEAHLRYILEISDYTTATIRNVMQLPKEFRGPALKEQVGYGLFWQKLVDEAADPREYPGPGQLRALRLLIIGALNATVEWWTPTRGGSLDDVVQSALIMVRRSLERR